MVDTMTEDKAPLNELANIESRPVKTRKKKNQKNRIKIDNKLTNTLPDKSTYKKIDISQAIKYRYINNLSLQEIGDRFGCSKQAINQALKPFEAIMKDKGTLDAYRSRKQDILESTEMELINQILDKDKLKKASTNNIAYAYQAIANQARLEAGKAINIIGYEDINRELVEIECEIAEIEGNDAIVSKSLENKESEAELWDRDTVQVGEPQPVSGTVSDVN